MTNFQHPLFSDISWKKLYLWFYHEQAQRKGSFSILLVSLGLGLELAILYIILPLRAKIVFLPPHLFPAINPYSSSKAGELGKSTPNLNLNPNPNSRRTPYCRRLQKSNEKKKVTHITKMVTHITAMGKYYNEDRKRVLTLLIFF